MNSHERRKDRRDKEFRYIDTPLRIDAKPTFAGFNLPKGIQPSHTVKEMNDPCPKYFIKCGCFCRWRFNS